MNSENKIGLARQAMILFLKSLPVGCHFNIIRFGSDHQSLFQNITNIYDEANVKVCQDFINQMKADLGGTELVSESFILMIYEQINLSESILLAITTSMGE